MSPSTVIRPLLIYTLFIVSTVLSAPREDIIPRWSTDGELHKTREAEFLEQPSIRLRKERFDVSREDEFLHRLARVAIEPPPKPDKSEEEKLGMDKSSLVDTRNDNAKLNVENSEIRDMRESHVTPKDDDDDDETPNDHEKSSSLLGKRSKTLEAKKSKITATMSTILPPVIFPDDNTIADIRTVNDQWLEMLKKTNYTTDEMQMNKDTTNRRETSTQPVIVIPMLPKPVSPDKVPVVESTTSAISAPTTTTAPITISPMTTTSPTTITVPKTIAAMTTVAASANTTAPTTSATSATTTTIAPTSVTSNSTNNETVSDNPTTTTTTTTDRPTSSSPSSAERKLHEKKKLEPASMPSGVVALITAISFAIFGIVAYIGLLVRKRYREWRYGNRELLVNDFDAADISNFEL